MKKNGKDKEDIPFVHLLTFKDGPRRIEPIFPIYESIEVDREGSHDAFVMGASENVDLKSFVSFVATVGLLRQLNYPERLNGLRKTNMVVVHGDSRIFREDPENEDQANGSIS